MLFSHAEKMVTSMKIKGAKNAVLEAMIADLLKLLQENEIKNKKKLEEQEAMFKEEIEAQIGKHQKALEAQSVKSNNLLDKKDVKRQEAQSEH